MTNEEIHKKLFLSIKDIQSATYHLRFYPDAVDDVSNIAAALRHLADAAQDLVSLFALLPKAFYPSLSDLQDMGFRHEELRQLGQPPHDPDPAYKQIINHAIETFKRSQDC
jgi:hypothetical protein